MVFLDRIDAVPLGGNEDLTLEIQRWMSTLVDSLNTTIDQIEPLIYDAMTITGTSQIADSNTRYIPLNAALTSIQLPATCVAGDVISVRGEGAGGWSILPAAGQTIQLLGMTASTSVASADRYDSIDVTCTYENLTWIVSAYVSAGLVIT